MQLFENQLLSTRWWWGSILAFEGLNEKRSSPISNQVWLIWNKLSPLITWPLYSRTHDISNAQIHVNPFPIYFPNITGDFGWKLWLRTPILGSKEWKHQPKSVRSFGETTWYPCGLLTWVIGQDQKEWLIVHAWSLTWKLKTSNPEREILLETIMFRYVQLFFFGWVFLISEISLTMHNLSKEMSKWPAIFRIVYGGLWQIYLLTLLVEFRSPIQDPGSWHINVYSLQTIE